MGCASAKHVSTVQNEEETQKGKNYQNGDVFGDEYRIKPVEEVKYMKNGGEDDQKIAARNQENLKKIALRIKAKSILTHLRTGNSVKLSHSDVPKPLKIWYINESWRAGLLSAHSILFAEKSASSNARLKSNKEIPGLVHQPRANMHISESQQEFFRMLDEKIEKGRDYCSEEEDVT